MSGIQYPVDIKDIGKFVHQNNISVNVYGYKDKKIFSVHITTITAASHHHHHCWQNISLRIGEELEQAGIDPI